MPHQTITAPSDITHDPEGFLPAPTITANNAKKPSAVIAQNDTITHTPTTPDVPCCSAHLLVPSTAAANALATKECAAEAARNSLDWAHDNTLSTNTALSTTLLNMSTKWIPCSFSVVMTQPDL